ncbi:MBL fold metallo-hydrolase [Streptomyces sp. URMC 123]|uniref:MBL fold metallo-hydrolase n=1 Tax=Streptomyces sp. URMC 123 TaxID=3423403 RepID=UPI003F1ACA86
MAEGVTDHGGGVWGIPVPIPDSPLGHTVVHLLDTDRGPVLVDTGWDDPSSWDALVAGLAACGADVADVHGVLITHHHPDHHGLSGRVREVSGAWVAMHPADIAVVRRTRDAADTGWLDHLLTQLTAAGAPDDQLAPLRAARRAGREALPAPVPALPDRAIVPGELLDVPGRRLRAVWTPGHTPGHVCLYLEERLPAGPGPGRYEAGPGPYEGSGPYEAGHRPYGEPLPAGGGGGRLFSGDHLLPGISPHVGLYEAPGAPGTADPLGDFLASLERIGRLAPARVLPAHRHAFTDAAGRVRELLDHHEKRLAETRALLTGEPRTMWEIAERTAWNRPWERIPLGSRAMAVSETEAHVRHLLRLGRAERVPGSDPPTYRAR